LRNQIEDAFQMEKGQVKINSLAGHVIVKGRRRDEIVRFLLDRQF
jgi:large subunit ribosomal protein L49